MYRGEATFVDASALVPGDIISLEVRAAAKSQLCSSASKEVFVGLVCFSNFHGAASFVSSEANFEILAIPTSSRKF